MDPRWKTPFTCLIAGSTSSGKSVWVKEFITHLSEMTYPVPDEVVWCYGEWQDAYNSLKARGVIFSEGLPDVDEWVNDRKRLVVLDDLMNEIFD